MCSESGFVFVQNITNLIKFSFSFLNPALTPHSNFHLPFLLNLGRNVFYGAADICVTRNRADVICKAVMFPSFHCSLCAS